MKNLIPSWIILAIFVSPVFAGGWETGRLDNSFMYEDESYAQFGILSVNYGVEANIQHPLASKHKMAKNQSRSAFAVKMAFGDFDIGLTRYHQSNQLDGQGQSGHRSFNCSNCICSVVPSADVTIYSTAYLARYSINENISVFAGLNQFALGDLRLQLSLPLQNSKSEMNSIWGWRKTRYRIKN